MARTPTATDEPSGFIWGLVLLMHYFSYAVAPLLIILSYWLMPEVRHKISYSVFIGTGDSELYKDLLVLALIGLAWNVTDSVVIVYRFTPPDMISENLIISIIITGVLLVISGIAFDRGALGWWLAGPTALSVVNLLMFTFVGYNVALLKRLLQEEGH